MRKFDNVMMETAKIWAEMSYCKRRKVGAVLSKDGRILATGYNGTIHGLDNMCEEFEPVEKDEEGSDVIVCPKCQGRGEVVIYFGPYGDVDKCTTCNGSGKVRVLDRTNEFTLHAEQNVLAFCAKNGIPVDGCTLYITDSPCKQCSN